MHFALFRICRFTGPNARAMKLTGGLGMPGLVAARVVPLPVRRCRRGRGQAGVEPGNVEYVAVGKGPQPQEVPGEAVIAASALVTGFAIGSLVRRSEMRCPEVEPSARHVACSSSRWAGSGSSSSIGAHKAGALRAGCHLALVRRPAQRRAHLRRLLQQRGGRHVDRRGCCSGGRRREPEGQARRLRAAVWRRAANVILIQSGRTEHGRRVACAQHLHLLLLQLRCEPGRSERLPLPLEAHFFQGQPVLRRRVQHRRQLQPRAASGVGEEYPSWVLVLGRRRGHRPRALLRQCVAERPVRDEAVPPAHERMNRLSS
jgi:hypothetical protein